MDRLGPTLGSRLFRLFLGAIVGAVAMIVLGQVFSLIGGTCNGLCRPQVAGINGAVFGAIAFGIHWD